MNSQTWDLDSFLRPHQLLSLAAVYRPRTVKIVPIKTPKTMSTCGSESSSSDEGRDRYEPIKRLALIQIQPPRNPNKPLTPFRITDILQPGGLKRNRADIEREDEAPVIRTTIVRPWDRTPSSPHSSKDEEDEDDDEDIEIDVEGDKPAVQRQQKGPSPLDALLQMTNKTFEGLGTHGQSTDDCGRRDQLNLFAKNQPPKKKRKSRTAFTNQQIYELEKRFLYQKYLTPADRDEIASTLGLTNAQVITWFQNRRAKLKRDLEELKADVTAAKSVTSSGIPENALSPLEASSPHSHTENSES